MSMPDIKMRRGNTNLRRARGDTRPNSVQTYNELK